MISSLHSSSISLADLPSPYLSLSFWATFLHTFSEVEKSLIMRLQCSILESVSGFLQFYLFCFVFLFVFILEAMVDLQSPWFHGTIFLSLTSSVTRKPFSPQRGSELPPLSLSKAVRVGYNVFLELGVPLLGPGATWILYWFLSLAILNFPTQGAIENVSVPFCVLLRPVKTGRKPSCFSRHLTTWFFQTLIEGATPANLTHRNAWTMSCIQLFSTMFVTHFIPLSLPLRAKGMVVT